MVNEGGLICSAEYKKNIQKFYWKTSATFHLRSSRYELEGNRNSRYRYSMRGVDWTELTQGRVF